MLHVGGAHWVWEARTRTCTCQWESVGSQTLGERASRGSTSNEPRAVLAVHTPVVLFGGVANEPRRAKVTRLVKGTVRRDLNLNGETKDNTSSSSNLVGGFEATPFLAQKWHFLIQRQKSTPAATRTNKNCSKPSNMLPSHVSNLIRHESTTRLRLCSSCSKSLKSGSAVLMALDQPFCSERCRSEFVFTQAEPTSEPHSRTYRQRSEGQGVFISDPKRSKDSPQSPREFIQLYPVTQPRWSESSLAT